MEILPNLQLIIAASLITASLFVITSMIFYKIGKREKKRTIERDNKSYKEKTEIKTGIIQPVESPKENGKIVTETNHIGNNESPVTNNGKTKKISPSEFYAKKIDSEINKKEEDNANKDIKESDFKFLKYTSKGYKPAKGDQEPGTLRWR